MKTPKFGQAVSHMKKYWPAYTAPPIMGAVTGALMAEVTQFAGSYPLNFSEHLMTDLYWAGLEAGTVTIGAYAVLGIEEGIKNLKKHDLPSHADPYHLILYSPFLITSATGITYGILDYMNTHNTLDAVSSGLLGVLFAGACSLTTTLGYATTIGISEKTNRFLKKRNARDLIKKGQEARESGDLDTALRYAERAHSRYPVAEAHLLAGDILFDKGSIEDAQYEYETGLREESLPHEKGHILTTEYILKQRLEKTAITKGLKDFEKTGYLPSLDNAIEETPITVYDYLEAFERTGEPRYMERAIEELNE